MADAYVMVFQPTVQLEYAINLEHETFRQQHRDDVSTERYAYVGTREHVPDKYVFVKFDVLGDLQYAQTNTSANKAHNQRGYSDNNMKQKCIESSVNIPKYVIDSIINNTLPEVKVTEYSNELLMCGAVFPYRIIEFIMQELMVPGFGMFGSITKQLELHNIQTLIHQASMGGRRIKLDNLSKAELLALARKRKVHSVKEYMTKSMIISLLKAR